MSFNASDELRLNNMTEKKINISTADEQIRQLYETAFPEDENDAKLSTCVTGLGTRMSIVPITTSP